MKVKKVAHRVRKNQREVVTQSQAMEKLDGGSNPIAQSQAMEKPDNGSRSILDALEGLSMAIVPYKALVLLREVFLEPTKEERTCPMAWLSRRLPELFKEK